MKVFAIVIALMAFGSSLRPQGKEATPSPTRQLQLKVPKDTWEPIFFKAIDKRAQLSHLKTLRAGALPDSDLELRVWHGFGLTALEGFVLKRANGNWSALHLDGISPHMPRSQYQKRLRAPKSGWDTCWKRLEDAGILTLPDASAIGCSELDEDGMSYVVEFNADGIYRTYMFDNPDYAKCNEAKRMIAIGNLISDEFGVPEMATK